MLEKHIYNEDFFKFIFEFFNNFPSFPFKQKDIPLPDYYTNHDAFKTLKPLIAKSAELILQYISEILYKANDKNTINDITKIVRGLLLLIPDEALGLAENYLFLKQKEIFELLLSCSELGVRTSAEQILITFISVISEHNKLFTDTNLFGERKEIYEKVTRFLTNLLNLLPQEVGKNWTKFQQYFDVILLFIFLILFYFQISGNLHLIIR